MDDLLGDFLAETAESLDLVDVQLVKFEREPNNAEILDNIFRLVHTIKGTCGFLGLPRLESVAHAAETLMGRFREGTQVTQEAVSLVLASLDRIKEIMADLEATQHEPAGTDEDLIGDLIRLASNDGSAKAAVVAAPEPVVELPEPTKGDLHPGEQSLEDLDAAFAAAASDVPIPDPRGSAAEPDAEVIAESIPAEQAGGRDQARGDTELDVRAKSIRVNVDTIEKLMTTVSELVLARNQLLEIARHVEDGVLQAPLQRLSSVTAELQERVMKTRMQPIGNAWQKLPRIIRTLANDLDKKIELEMIGADTELDRQVLELIRDPLTHMIRNAADHGLEDTKARLAAGKSAVGHVTLSARHEGGHIVIEISDDGRGLPADKIRKKAIERGLVAPADADSMTAAQITRMIFEPGFSTADSVTNVSGRGVGMDVVRTNIELIGGSVDVISVEGEGSKFTIQIPLTLAIVPALIIGAGGQRYALPQLNIIELVRVRAGDEHAIETVNGSPILRLRGRLLPLVRLSSFFRHAKPAQPTTEDGVERAGVDNEFVAVLRIGGFDFGIVAEVVFDTEEIVVKPLTGLLKNVKAFSGNTILGDGSVVMIIDPSGVAEAAGMRAATRSLNAAHVDEADGLDDGDEAVSLLVFRAGSKDPRALPLALINRLEEIDLATVERSAGHDVIQYRNVLMPLIRLDDGAHEGMKPVIVIESNGYYTGLVVDEIVDVVEERLTIEADTSGSGALGSAVIAGKVTEIVDLAYYMPQTLHAGTGTRRHEHSLRVLLVDDSAFFRNMLKPFLAAHGFYVAAVSSAAEALEVGKRGRHFDVIVSDIEMPDMNGYEFIGAAREASLWQTSRFIALSGHAGGDVIDKAHDAGYAEHVAKFDRTRLLDILKSNGQNVEVAA